MYNVNDITTLDIESINNCNAKCPLCLRGQGMNTNDILDWNKIISNISDTVWQNLQTINFNGTTGDNLMHPNIKDIVLWTCQNTSATINIHTNGGIRDRKWWNNFGSMLTSYKHRVVFGIDGLADTHSTYRIGTNWQRVIDNATAFIQGGGHAEWQFILFKHNSHQVDQAKVLSENLGFKNFFVLYQDRFNNDNMIIQNGSQVEKYDQDISQLNIPVVVRSTSNDLTKRISASNQKIICRSQKIGWISIYADGTVWPCCWLMGWHKAQHQTQFKLIDYHFKKILNLDFNEINLYNNTLENIINSDLWQNRYPKSFINQPNSVCLQQCSGTKE
jgi:hypothetical protein